MKCSQMGCDDLASHRVFWPGNPPLPVCWIHTNTAIGIANSMGLYVHVEEIPNDSSGEGENGGKNSKGEVY